MGGMAAIPTRRHPDFRRLGAVAAVAALVALGGCTAKSPAARTATGSDPIVTGSTGAAPARRQAGLKPLSPPQRLGELARALEAQNPPDEPPAASRAPVIVGADGRLHVSPTLDLPPPQTDMADGSRQRE